MPASVLTALYSAGWLVWAYGLYATGFNARLAHRWRGLCEKSFAREAEAIKIAREASDAIEVLRNLGGALRADAIASCAIDIAAMPIMGCWAKVLEDSEWDEAQPPVGCVRLHAFRLPSGRWQLTLEEYCQMSVDFPSFMEWEVLDREWNPEGYPTVQCHLDVGAVDEIEPALKLVAMWVQDLCVSSRGNVTEAPNGQA